MLLTVLGETAPPGTGQKGMRAIWNGETIAESEDTVVVEGNHYFPLASVDERFIAPSRMKSVCPWKGVASYYHVDAGGTRLPNAAWTYRRPFPWVRRIRRRVAFWHGVEVVDR
jgi:uncharacterized protein (DUF427 family)